MHITLTEGGALSMLLSNEELAAMGVTFDELDDRRPKTRRILRTLLQLAARRTGFSPDGALTIEALPLADGCLLLVTPNTDTVRVFFVADENALLQLATAWPYTTHTDNASSSLYRTDDGFWLVLCNAPPFPALWECAVPSDIGAGFLEEHAVPLLCGNALPYMHKAVTANG